MTIFTTAQLGWRIVVFYFLVCVLMISADPGLLNWFDSLAYDRKEGHSIIGRLVVLLATAGIVMLPLLAPSRLLRLPVLLLILVFMTTGISFRLINGQFSIWEATLLLNESAFAADAIAEFIAEVAQAFCFSLLAVVVLLLTRPPVSLSLKASAWLFLPLLLPGLYLHFAQGGYWIRHFSLPLKVPATIAFAADSPYTQQARQPPRIVQRNVVTHNIILIVDESIRGDFLTINNSFETTTPYLSKLVAEQGWQNFGVVSAMANCSAPANLLLRTGIPPSALPHQAVRLFRDANIFQYANASGFYTEYFDGQVKGKRLNNYFTRHEIAVIDDYRPFRNHYALDEAEVDQRMAASVAGVLNDQTQPVFMYINKVGTHFPYQLTYPDILQQPDDVKLDHYRRAVNWNVDRFLQVLVAGLEHNGEPTLIFYTSDHGQGLGEQGIRSTHCLPRGVPDVQARIPLVIGAVGMAMPQHWQVQAGQYSQFQLFPSLIRAMGLTIEQPDLALDLSQPWPSARFFLSGDITGRGQLSRNPFLYRDRETVGR